MRRVRTTIIWFQIGSVVFSSNRRKMKIQIFDVDFINFIQNSIFICFVSKKIPTDEKKHPMEQQSEGQLRRQAQELAEEGTEAVQLAEDVANNKNSSGAEVAPAGLAEPQAVEPQQSSESDNLRIRLVQQMLYENK